MIIIDICKKGIENVRIFMCYVVFNFTKSYKIAGLFKQKEIQSIKAALLKLICSQPAAHSSQLY